MSSKTLAWANKEVETFVCILGEEDVVYDVYVAAAAIDIRPTTKVPQRRSPENEAKTGVILGLLLKNAYSYTALEIWIQTFKPLDYSDSGRGISDARVGDLNQSVAPQTKPFVEPLGVVSFCGRISLTGGLGIRCGKYLAVQDWGKQTVQTSTLGNQSEQRRVNGVEHLPHGRGPAVPV
ncbi:unnamed protein product [Boreogadus saida]